MLTAYAVKAYAVADAYQNPDIYTNPRDWDPARFLPGREEDQKEKFGFVGWGTGRHPCLGKNCRFYSTITDRMTHRHESTCQALYSP